MKLNCRPGDLARILSTTESRHTGAADRFIRVTQLNPVFPTAWNYEGPPLSCACCGLTLIAIEDCVLRPIRDPGEDATDETLQWCPRPEQLEALS